VIYSLIAAEHRRESEEGDPATPVLARA
jgi:hypothetical protein